MCNYINFFFLFILVISICNCNFLDPHTGFPTPIPKKLPDINLDLVEMNGTLKMGTVVINGTPRYGEPIKESHVSCLIKNNGEDDLEVQQIQFTNSDFYTTMETPFTILPGNSEEIDFRFKPSIRGKISGIATLEDNDPLTKSFQFKIEGIGVDVVEINEMFTEATEPDDDIEFPLPAGYTKYSLDLMIVGGGGTGGQGGSGGSGGRGGRDCENCTGGDGGPGGGGGGGAGGYAGELLEAPYITTGLITLSIKVGSSGTVSSVSYTNGQGELETLTALPGPTGETGGSCWPGGADGEDADCNVVPCEDGGGGYDGPGGMGGGKGTPRAGGDGQRGWSGGSGGAGGAGQLGPIDDYPNYGRGGNGSRGSNGGAGTEEFGQDSPPEPTILPSPGYPGAVLVTIYGYLDD